MNTETLVSTEQTASWLLQKLHEQQTPIGLQELEVRFAASSGLSHRTLKETAWKLVEEGKVYFTSSWDLALSKESSTAQIY